MVDIHTGDRLLLIKATSVVNAAFGENTRQPFESSTCLRNLRMGSRSLQSNCYDITGWEIVFPVVQSQPRCWRTVGYSAAAICVLKDKGQVCVGNY